MKFILHSDFTDDTIREHLGAPDYSYYFVLKAFQPVLAELGSVEVVRHPEIDVDPIYDACRARGEPCVFFSFGPPHKTPLGLRCPTIPVIAWEFSTIPNESWGDDPRNDWRIPLAKVGCAIALSSASGQIIAAAVGPQVVVGAMPTPIPDRLSGAARLGAICGGIDLHVNGEVLDTATMDLQIDAMAPAAPPNVTAAKLSRFQRALRSGLIWAYARLERFRAPDPEIPPGSDGVQAAASSPGRVHLGGLVYTAVLNPNDGRKNIYDLVMAFCWAFRDSADATLVLKLVNRDARGFYNVLIPVLYHLSPFKCRVVALQGYLEDNEFNRLFEATSYYVNASTSEGLCMPLMEFMASGIPAIAPVHTAMEDYIDDSVAFTLRATRQITVWPHDARDLFRTMCYRLDWGSLVEAFQRSYRLAKDDPQAYGDMAQRARDKMHGYASPAAVKEKLRRFLSITEAAAGTQAATGQIAARE